MATFGGGEWESAAAFIAGWLLVDIIRWTQGRS